MFLDVSAGISMKHVNYWKIVTDTKNNVVTSTTAKYYFIALIK